MTSPGDERAVHQTFCRLCISLCGLLVTTEGDRVVKVSGDPQHPVSRGYTCPKGRALGHLHHDPRRLDRPLMRRAGRLVETSWDACLDDLATRLARIVEESGPDAVGIYLATASAFDVSGRRAAERLFRAIGSRSKYTATTIDTPCKPLIAELMTGNPTLVPGVDQERARLVLLFGLNPVVSHGHFSAMPMPAARLREVADRGGEVWVVDPRRTETAAVATRHLAIRPGTDYAVLAYLVRELLAKGADTGYLAEHASGLSELAAAVAPYDLRTAADRAGVPEADLADLLAAVRRHGRVAGQSGTGLTMSAAANVSEWLLWSLHVVTASYDRPGGMWFHPGFIKCLDERPWPPGDARAAPGPPSRPELPSRWGEIPCAALSDEVTAGNLRALLVVGGNPVTALPETARLVPALRQLDVLAVADVMRTDTTDLATHVLACTGQLERADLPGYVDQFQAEIAGQLTHAVVRPGAERRAMWWCWAQLGARLGHPVLPDGMHPDEVSDEDLLRTLADRSKASYEELDAAESAIVWRSSTFGWVHEHVLPGGRWLLAPAPLVEQLSTLTAPPALTLVPRRQRRHVNSLLRDGSGPYGTERDAPEVLVHPADAAEHRIADGAVVEVRSSSGVLLGRARFDPHIRRGVVSVPHGFAETNVNRLTSASKGVDPLTGMVLQSGIEVTLCAPSTA
jgi:anaerobic selenocysteine-containing dehydrogenase